MLSTHATASMPLAAGDATDDADERIALYGVTWQQYVALREMFDERPGIRLTYLKGTLEIMSPSNVHEKVKTLLGRLIELYALEKDIALYGYGSTTFKKEAVERGLEPDECYLVGEDLPEDGVPHFAIEVNLVRRGIDKLAVYAGLGVPEVWTWHKGKIEVFRLKGDVYEKHTKSVYLPELDLALLASLATFADQVAALKAFRDLLRARA